MAINIPEKQYLENVLSAGVADKKTVMSVVYKNTETALAWGKRFVVDKFILDKPYTYFDASNELQYFSSDADPVVELHFVTNAKQKEKMLLCPLKALAVQGAQTRGIRLSKNKVKKVVEFKGKKGSVNVQQSLLPLDWED